jgi:uncharacterized protein involved in outer membrane biogenesis
MLPTKDLTMSISRALVAFLLLLLIAAVGIVLYLQFGDMNRHRQSIQNLVSGSVGREFHIIGDLKVTLIPSTTLSAHGLTLANASWGSQPLMLEVGELSVALNPWSLLAGPLEIERFTLDGIKVLEERNREGQSNWILAAASAGPQGDSGETNIDSQDSGGLPMVIHEIEIKDAILSLLRPEAGGRIIQIDELTLQPGSTGDLDLQGTGQFLGLPLALSGAVGPLDRLKAQGSSIDTGVTVSLGKLAVQLDDLKVEFGDSALEGSAYVIMEENTIIQADLKSRQIDLGPFQTPEDEAAMPGEVKSEEKYFFVEEPLPFETLKSIDADIHIEIGKLKGAGLAIENLLFDGRLHGGKLTAQLEFGTADGGAVVSTTKVATGGENADLEVSIKARDLRINVASGEIDDPAQIPPISVTLDLKSSGMSPRAFAAGATGQLLITQGAGRVNNKLLGRISGDIFAQLTSALNPMAEAEKYTNFECGIIVVDFADGMSDLGTLIIQGEKVLIVADGTVDLDTEQLNIEFKTQPRRGRGVSADRFVTPFIALKGTLIAPAVGLNQKSTLAAVATSGISLVVQAAMGRVAAEVDHCEKTLPEFPHPPLKAA